MRPGGRRAASIAVISNGERSKYLSNNGPWDQLVRYENIALQMLTDGKGIELAGDATVTPFVVPHREEYSETVGFRIDGPNRSAVYLPDIDKWEMWSTDVRDVVRDVDYALLDATFFKDGELGERDMSKVRHPFVSESMALFESMSDEERRRVIFIHMNHTNPLLHDGSPAQAAVERRGFRFAREGMRLDL